MNKKLTYLRGKTTILALLFVALFHLCACDKVNSLENLGLQEVVLKVDWSGTDLANTNAEATVYIYPPTGAVPTVLTGVTGQGTSVILVGGVNKIAMHNSEMNQLQILNVSKYENIHAKVNELSDVKLPTGQGQTEMPDLPTKYIPSLDDKLMIISANSQIAAAGDNTTVITLKPKNTVYKYKFIVNIPTVYNVTNITAALSGIASTTYLSTTKTTTENQSNALIELELEQSNYSQITAEGEFNHLGLIPNNGEINTNVLSLYIETEYVVEDFINNYKKDLTEYFNDFQGQNLIITLNATTPDPENGEIITFEVTVEPWIEKDGGEMDLEPEQK